MSANEPVYMKSYITFEPSNEKNKNLYGKPYSTKTLTYYRILRKNKINVMDPSNDNLLFEHSKSFKYKYIWNPVTGKKTDEKDPYGPLYFFPDDLINYFYERRLYKLWSDSDGYGEYVGSGETLSYNQNYDKTQDYLFRLPVTDCYLFEDTCNSTITMGPMLTFKEIEKLYNIATKYYKNNYINKYGRPRPDLVLMYRYYTNAIAKVPELNCNIDIVQIENVNEIYAGQNMEYVDKLKDI